MDSNKASFDRNGHNKKSQKEPPKLGISLHDRKTNEWIRSTTKVSLITIAILNLKWNMLGTWHD